MRKTHSVDWRSGLRFLAVVWMMLLFRAPAVAQVPGAHEWPNTDFTKSSVELSEIISGGPPKDGIPAIDEPKFETIGEADQWLNLKEPVIVVTLNGVAHAYPLQILIWHEIVNDTVGGVPVTVTFCPLCNSSIVFDRRVAGRVLDFGTTGRLRKSDLVMYDRQTESWWQQLIGEAIVGSLVGEKLTKLPGQIVSFEDFKHAYPEGRVLSRKTGHVRDYGRNPYRGYDSIEDQPFLFFDPVDPRLPPMERVLDIAVADQRRIYPFSVLRDRPVVNDKLAGRAVVVFAKLGTLSVLDRDRIAESRPVVSATAFGRELKGRTLSFELRESRIVDRETGTEWNLMGQAIRGDLAGEQLEPLNGGVHFAFAWLAFNPDTSIFGHTAP